MFGAFAQLEELSELGDKGAASFPGKPVALPAGAGCVGRWQVRDPTSPVSSFVPLQAKGTWRVMAGLSDGDLTRFSCACPPWGHSDGLATFRFLGSRGQKNACFSEERSCILQMCSGPAWPLGQDRGGMGPEPLPWSARSASHELTCFSSSRVNRDRLHLTDGETEAPVPPLALNPGPSKGAASCPSPLSPVVVSSHSINPR